MSTVFVSGTSGGNGLNGAVPGQSGGVGGKGGNASAVAGSVAERGLIATTADQLSAR